MSVKNEIRLPLLEKYGDSSSDDEVDIFPDMNKGNQDISRPPHGPSFSTRPVEQQARQLDAIEDNSITNGRSSNTKHMESFSNEFGLSENLVDVVDDDDKSDIIYQTSETTDEDANFEGNNYHFDGFFSIGTSAIFNAPHSTEDSGGEENDEKMQKENLPEYFLSRAGSFNNEKEEVKENGASSTGWMEKDFEGDDIDTGLQFFEGNSRQASLVIGEENVGGNDVDTEPEASKEPQEVYLEERVEYRKDKSHQSPEAKNYRQSELTHTVSATESTERPRKKKKKKKKDPDSTEDLDRDTITGEQDENDQMRQFPETMESQQSEMSTAFATTEPSSPRKTKKKDGGNKGKKRNRKNSENDPKRKTEDEKLTTKVEDKKDDEDSSVKSTQQIGTNEEINAELSNEDPGALIRSDPPLPSARNVGSLSRTWNKEKIREKTQAKAKRGPGLNVFTLARKAVTGKPQGSDSGESVPSSSLGPGSDASSRASPRVEERRSQRRKKSRRGRQNARRKGGYEELDDSSSDSLEGSVDSMEVWHPPRRASALDPAQTNIVSSWHSQSSAGPSEEIPNFDWWGSTESNRGRQNTTSLDQENDQGEETRSDALADEFSKAPIAHSASSNQSNKRESGHQKVLDWPGQKISGLASNMSSGTLDKSLGPERLNSPNSKVSLLSDDINPLRSSKIDFVSPSPIAVIQFDPKVLNSSPNPGKLQEEVGRGNSSFLSGSDLKRNALPGGISFTEKKSQDTPHHRSQITENYQTSSLSITRGSSENSKNGRRDNAFLTQTDERPQQFIYDEERKQATVIQAAARGHLARLKYPTINRSSRINPISAHRQETRSKALGKTNREPIAPLKSSMAPSRADDAKKKMNSKHGYNHDEKKHPVHIRYYAHTDDLKTVEEQKEARKRAYLKDQQRLHSIRIQSVIRGYKARKNYERLRTAEYRKKKATNNGTSSAWAISPTGGPKPTRRQAESEPYASSLEASLLRPWNTRKTPPTSSQINSSEEPHVRKARGKARSSIKHFDRSLYLRQRMHNDEQESQMKPIDKIREERRKMYLRDLERRESIKIQAAARGYLLRKGYKTSRQKKKRKKKKKHKKKSKSKSNRFDEDRGVPTSNANPSKTGVNMPQRANIHLQQLETISKFDRVSYLQERLQCDEKERKKKTLSEIQAERMQIYLHDLERREATRIQAAVRAYRVRRRYPNIARKRRRRAALEKKKSRHKSKKRKLTIGKLLSFFFGEAIEQDIQIAHTHQSNTKRDRIDNPNMEEDGSFFGFEDPAYNERNERERILAQKKLEKSQVAKIQSPTRGHLAHRVTDKRKKQLQKLDALNSALFEEVERRPETYKANSTPALLKANSEKPLSKRRYEGHSHSQIQKNWRKSSQKPKSGFYMHDDGVVEIEVVDENNIVKHPSKHKVAHRSTYTNDVGDSWWLPSVGTKDHRVYRDSNDACVSITRQRVYVSPPPKRATTDYWEAVRGKCLPAPSSSAYFTSRKSQPSAQNLQSSGNSVEDGISSWLPPSNGNSLSKFSKDGYDAKQREVNRGSRPLILPYRVDFAGEVKMKETFCWAPHLPSPSKRDNSRVDRAIASVLGNTLPLDASSNSASKDSRRGDGNDDDIETGVQQTSETLAHPPETSQPQKSRSTIVVIGLLLVLIGGGIIAAYFFWENAPWAR